PHPPHPSRPPRLKRAVRAGAVRGLVPPWLWTRLQPTGVWELHTCDGTPFRYAAAEDDEHSRSFVWTDLRHWEEATCPVFCALARRSRGFLGVSAGTGTCAGLYTLLACTANPALRAVTVEPHPAAAGRLRHNLAVNGLEQRVSVVERAPTDRAVGPLPVDLVKIDGAGPAADVLRGMPRTLARHRPIVIAGCPDRDALDRLRAEGAAHGYETVLHLGTAGPRRAPEGFTPPARHRNFLLTAG
ncbi:hypothetical protein, partial [Streptomyces boncukensis]